MLSQMARQGPGFKKAKPWQNVESFHLGGDGTVRLWNLKDFRRLGPITLLKVSRCQGHSFLPGQQCSSPCGLPIKRHAADDEQRRWSGEAMAHQESFKLTEGTKLY